MQSTSWKPTINSLCMRCECTVEKYWHRIDKKVILKWSNDQCGAERTDTILWLGFAPNFNQDNRKIIWTKINISAEQWTYWNGRIWKDICVSCLVQILWHWVWCLDCWSSAGLTGVWHCARRWYNCVTWPALQYHGGVVTSDQECHSTQECRDLNDNLSWFLPAHFSPSSQIILNKNIWCGHAMFLQWARSSLIIHINMLNMQQAFHLIVQQCWWWC